jgi:carbon storage regulator
MLVLSRRVGEEIVIDGRIRLIVLAVHGGVARLGVKAPSCVTVDREEVHVRRGSAQLRKVREADQSRDPPNTPRMERLQESRFMEFEHQPNEAVWHGLLARATTFGRARSPCHLRTARIEEGECPVIVRDRAGDEREIACSFLHFLTLAALSAAECVVKA